MDFYQIVERQIKKGMYSISPDFKVCRSKDLMVRGKSFYAVWDEDKQLWSTDESDVQRLIDREIDSYVQQRRLKYPDDILEIKSMMSYSSNAWHQYRSFLKDMYDTSHQLDTCVTFANTPVTKTDYISHRLDYPIEEGKIDSYDKLMGTLFDPEERQKLEWAVGAIISGEAKDIQKFIVLYGEPGSGKSTFLNILQKMFSGYYSLFEAKALTNSNNSFSMEMFRSNPLLAIQHDGDLSKIEDNTKLNSIVSHEEMIVNEKFKSSYSARLNAFLFLGTNKPVKITDSKSGLLRRLIDTRPSGRRVSPSQYNSLANKINFELGAIAYHCLQVFLNLGKNYYANYRPLEMMYQTDVFFNFVEDSFYVFKEQDGISLAQAYDMYKAYCDDALVEYKLAKYKFREELKSYFEEFNDRTRVDDKQVRNYYSGFITSKFDQGEKEKKEPTNSAAGLILNSKVSLLDEMLAEYSAQYATPNEKPEKKWDTITTTLSDLDTHRIHFVRPPENHIVIDFDLKDETGKKSMTKNLEAASKWPSTYAEFSKSESGIHLHYIYNGDVNRLSRLYSEGIEIKVFIGNSSLRRRLTMCNTTAVATINSGLPLRGEKMINFEGVKSEKKLRDLIIRNLKKEFHPGTKPSIDFIHKILEDAYSSGLKYDVTDLRPSILVFANNSSNQSEYCIKLIQQMKFASEEISVTSDADYKTEELIFYDVEVFPNLFIIVWKRAGGKKVKMINPSSADVEKLLPFKLVGFNCRRYDNHILYARYIGYNNEQLYNLSQKIINGSKNAMFGEAYNLSYTDVYDFASAVNKKSLKKFEIELGIHHQELGLPWDQPVPEELWETVADYCCNDVDATEITFNHLSGDWAARQILAEISGLTVNDTTNAHSTKIMFGSDKNPQSQFVYTDLSTIFPGYTFDFGKSLYRGEDPKEGGYVYSEPGMYSFVALLDIASMHPTSIEELNLFGPYTERFSEIKNGRLFIKHKEYDKVKQILDGKFAPFVEQIESGTATYTAKDLSNALKTVINSVYGLTSAKFDNKFRDPRNKDNIVAKRGALFMIDLKYAVQEKGFTVAHIKTDSIKIPNATPEIIQFVMDFGKKYGYTFEHEATYQKMCLVNNAVYIAQYATQEQCKQLYGYIPSDIEDTPGEWTATGAQFAQPYVFKNLFSHEPLEFSDMCEVLSVQTALYLDMNENLPDVSEYEKQVDKIVSIGKKNGIIIDITKPTGDGELDPLLEQISKGHEYHFVGKTGSFCPIKDGCGGGVLLREKDGLYHAATGSKGYRWMESEMVQTLNKEDDINLDFYNELVDAAVKDISVYGDFEWFISDITVDLDNKDPIGFNDTPPWCEEGDNFHESCKGCNQLYTDEVFGISCKLGKDLPF